MPECLCDSYTARVGNRTWSPQGTAKLSRGTETQWTDRHKVPATHRGTEIINRQALDTRKNTPQLQKPNTHHPRTSTPGLPPPHLCVCISFGVCMSLSACLSPSFCFSLSLVSLSVYLSVCLSLFLTRAHVHTHTHTHAHTRTHFQNTQWKLNQKTLPTPLASHRAYPPHSLLPSSKSIFLAVL